MCELVWVINIVLLLICSRRNGSTQLARLLQGACI